jgi:cadmium resistance protein CadD (predicted permease)
MTTHHEAKAGGEDFSAYIHALLTWVTSNIATLLVAFIALIIILVLIADLNAARTLVPVNYIPVG